MNSDRVFGVGIDQHRDKPTSDADNKYRNLSIHEGLDKGLLGLGHLINSDTLKDNEIKNILALEGSKKAILKDVTPAGKVIGNLAEGIANPAVLGGNALATIAGIGSGGLGAPAVIGIDSVYQTMLQDTYHYDLTGQHLSLEEGAKELGTNAIVGGLFHGAGHVVKKVASKIKPEEINTEVTANVALRSTQRIEDKTVGEVKQDVIDHYNDGETQDRYSQDNQEAPNGVDPNIVHGGNTEAFKKNINSIIGGDEEELVTTHNYTNAEIENKTIMDRKLTSELADVQNAKATLKKQENVEFKQMEEHKEKVKALNEDIKIHKRIVAKKKTISALKDKIGKEGHDGLEDLIKRHEKSLVELEQKPKHTLDQITEKINGLKVENEALSNSNNGLLATDGTKVDMSASDIKIVKRLHAKDGNIATEVTEASVDTLTKLRDDMYRRQKTDPNAKILLNTGKHYEAIDRAILADANNFEAQVGNVKSDYIRKIGMEPEEMVKLYGANNHDLAEAWITGEFDNLHPEHVNGVKAIMRSGEHIDSLRIGKEINSIEDMEANNVLGREFDGLLDADGEIKYDDSTVRIIKEAMDKNKVSVVRGILEETSTVKNFLDGLEDTISQDGTFPSGIDREELKKLAPWYYKNRDKLLSKLDTLENDKFEYEENVKLLDEWSTDDYADVIEASKKQATFKALGDEHKIFKKEHERNIVALKKDKAKAIKSLEKTGLKVDKKGKVLKGIDRSVEAHKKMTDDIAKVEQSIKDIREVATTQRAGAEAHATTIKNLRAKIKKTKGVDAQQKIRVAIDKEIILKNEKTANAIKSEQHAKSLEKSLKSSHKDLKALQDKINTKDKHTKEFEDDKELIKTHDEYIELVDNNIKVEEGKLLMRENAIEKFNKKYSDVGNEMKGIKKANTKTALVIRKKIMDVVKHENKYANRDINAEIEQTNKAFEANESATEHTELVSMKLNKLVRKDRVIARMKEFTKGTVGEGNLTVDIKAFDESEFSEHFKDAHQFLEFYKGLRNTSQNARFAGKYRSLSSLQEFFGYDIDKLNKFFTSDAMKPFIKSNAELIDHLFTSQADQEAMYVHYGDVSPFTIMSKMARQNSAMLTNAHLKDTMSTDIKRTLTDLVTNRQHNIIKNRLLGVGGLDPFEVRATKKLMSAFKTTSLIATGTPELMGANYFMSLYKANRLSSSGLLHFPKEVVFSLGRLIGKDGAEQTGTEASERISDALIAKELFERQSVAHLNKPQKVGKAVSDIAYKIQQISDVQMKRMAFTRADSALYSLPKAYERLNNDMKLRLKTHGITEENYVEFKEFAHSHIKNAGYRSDVAVLDRLIRYGNDKEGHANALKRVLYDVQETTGNILEKSKMNDQTKGSISKTIGQQMSGYATASMKEVTERVLHRTTRDGLTVNRFTPSKKYNMFSDSSTNGKLCGVGAIMASTAYIIASQKAYKFTSDLISTQGDFNNRLATAITDLKSEVLIYEYDDKHKAIDLATEVLEDLGVGATGATGVSTYAFSKFKGAWNMIKTIKDGKEGTTDKAFKHLIFNSTLRGVYDFFNPSMVPATPYGQTQFEKFHKLEMERNLDSRSIDDIVGIASDIIGYHKSPVVRDIVNQSMLKDDEDKLKVLTKDNSSYDALHQDTKNTLETDPEFVNKSPEVKEHLKREYAITRETPSGTTRHVVAKGYDLLSQDDKDTFVLMQAFNRKKDISASEYDDYTKMISDGRSKSYILKAYGVDEDMFNNTYSDDNIKNSVLKHGRKLYRK